MRISIIIGLVALIIAITSFFIAFVFLEMKLERKYIRIQEFFIFLFFFSGSVLSICIAINVIHYWPNFVRILKKVFSF